MTSVPCCPLNTLSIYNTHDNQVHTIKWDTVIVLHGLQCICLIFKVNICSSFTATGSVIVNRCFLQCPKFWKQLLWRRTKRSIMFRALKSKQCGFPKSWMIYLDIRVRDSKVQIGNQQLPTSFRCNDSCCTWASTSILMLLKHVMLPFVWQLSGLRGATEENSISIRLHVERHILRPDQDKY